MFGEGQSSKFTKPPTGLYEVLTFVPIRRRKSLRREVFSDDRHVPHYDVRGLETCAILKPMITSRPSKQC